MPVIDDAAYVGAIPTHYHEGIGPFLFEPFAQLTAERVRAFGPTSAPGARSIAEGLVEGYPLVDEIKARGQVAVPAVVDAVAEFLVGRYGQGPIKTRIAALCATATA